jgi:hypothetical protein
MTISNGFAGSFVDGKKQLLQPALNIKAYGVVRALIHLVCTKSDRLLACRTEISGHVLVNSTDDQALTAPEALENW